MPSLSGHGNDSATIAGNPGASNTPAGITNQSATLGRILSNLQSLYGDGAYGSGVYGGTQGSNTATPSPVSSAAKTPNAHSNTAKTPNPHSPRSATLTTVTDDTATLSAH